ncbi:TonB-dependent receptor plug domain-containing protein [Formosa algae]|uniref:Iron complex outermembrane receptor protein n=1 Tax=Formosa algae TaxID=225843 RepID=A0A9X0YNR4_9FLAO|nr:TonB-dependent receptor [Formosa algae]MBP1840351.1 iron complex outermembrane receptor protein [Formosa algae]MDQ0334215.1 iron complex outermembrane receptor protein [Formosa algae]OEI82209.1 TonB-dependent receptor [Formosa algae]
MTVTKILSALTILSSTFAFAQEAMPEEALDEVIITSSRIELPFSKNSRSINIITAEDIKASAATNVADLLQQVAGVDIRRRGTAGMQADLYIRGGSFDQTLLLIDGIKVEDSQTGHHTLNMALPIDVIERIEIISGPAARVFGQNAFTGAVNIVTKRQTADLLSVETQAGSFHTLNGAITGGVNLKDSNHLVHVSRNTSEGYRHNTDYDNQNYFLKSTFNKSKLPINVIASMSERKFGANGFYATPSATEQYEETQTSLIGVSTKIKKDSWIFKPQVYWRRNQDMYLYTRDQPTGYRNLHITNKVGTELNGSYTSDLGITGFGVDLSKTYIVSNNLGDHNRFMSSMFLEHQFKLLNDKLDITPGVAVTYFSDFKWHAFPGVDLGYEINSNFKVYGNIGYTYRIPTYTDLYYSDPTTLGNENLDPEEAIAEELGIKYNHQNFSASLALFNRDSKNLIDYTKTNEDDLWEASNIRELNTKGLDAYLNYDFEIGANPQTINVSYTYINDEVQDVNADYSRYSINSLKHHIVGRYSSEFIKNVSQSIIYKYAERTAGDSYTVVDASVNYTLKTLEFSVIANNIFNEEYTEANLVPMPKGNLIFGLKYTFR